MTNEMIADCPDGAARMAATLTPFLGEDAREHLERDGARYVPPFLLWLDGPEVVLGHVARGRVMSSGAMDPGLARELSAALLEYAGKAEAEAGILPDDPLLWAVGELWYSPAAGERNGLSARTLNLLIRSGCKTGADLTTATAADLTDIRNFGAGCLAELRRVLSANGLALAGEEASGA